MNYVHVCFILRYTHCYLYVLIYIYIYISHYTVKNKGTLEFTNGYARNKRVRYTLQVKRTLKWYATCHKRVHYF